MLSTGSTARPISHDGDKRQTLHIIWEKMVNKWARSLLKLCYRELIIYLLLFKSMSCIQRYILNESQQK